MTDDNSINRREVFNICNRRRPVAIIGKARVFDRTNFVTEDRITKDVGTIKLKLEMKEMLVFDLLVLEDTLI